MIFSFFFLLSYVLKVFKNKICKKAFSSGSHNKTDCILLLECFEFNGEAFFDDEVGVRFNPPAYLQRYNAVTEILSNMQFLIDIKKVVDMGCSELSFFKFMRDLECVEEYIGVDVDLTVLERNRCSTYPRSPECLHRRYSPLHVLILNGSASEPDIRLKNANAIVAIELIEHMYPQELDDLPYNIFGVIQPDLAIFTTPNADFNVLFKSLLSNQFRHHDHKFEWSRSQFEDWGNNIALRYPGFSVWFKGIGSGPDGTEEFGCCSQIAVFVRNGQKTESTEFNEIYKSVYEVEYNYDTAEDVLRSILDQELPITINSLSDNPEYIVGDKIRIPLDDVRNKLGRYCSERRLKKALEERSTHRVECINNKLYLVLHPDDETYRYNSDISSHNSYNQNSSDPDDMIWGIDEDFSKKRTNPNENHPENDFISIHEEIHPRVINDLHFSESSKSDELPKSDKICGENYIKSATTALRTDQSFVKDVNIESCIKSCADNTCILKNNIQIIDSFIELEKSPSVSSATTELRTQQNILTSFPKNIELSLPSNVTYNKGKKEDLVEIINDFSEDDSPNHKKNISENTIQQNREMSTSYSKSFSDKYYENYAVHKYVNEISYDQTSSGTVPRSQSLENVSMYNCKNKNFRYSLNIDNKELDCDTVIVDMELDVCCKRSSLPSLTEPCSHSKAIDSGYINSMQDMDLDLTPEQVDEIITETESSLEDEESSADERIEQGQGNPPVVFEDNVENGDVANNNRDGEGNNMEGGQVLAEELVFEDLVLGGEEQEAAEEQESDDEGLFMSALEASNGTIVPEELSSAEDTLYLFDFPSTSSADSFQVEDVSFHNPPTNGFPAWLLNMIVVDDDYGSGDAGHDTEESSNKSVVNRED